MNRGRVINRAERGSTLSVKELGKMFEELIHASVATSSDCAAKRRSSTLPSRNQNVRIKATILRIQKTNDKVTSGGQGSKLAPKIEINVKNRKQFFEDQVHAIESSIGAKKHDSTPPLRSKYSSHKPGELSHTNNTNRIQGDYVKTRRTSEKNLNGTDSNISSPSKSLEFTKQHAKSNPDLNVPSLSNGYTNKKTGVMRTSFNETNEIRPKSGRKIPISRDTSTNRNKPVYKNSRSTEDWCPTTPSGVHLNRNKNLESKVTNRIIDKVGTEDNKDVTYDIITKNTVSIENNDVVYGIITENIADNKENGDYYIITQNTTENEENSENVAYDKITQNTAENLHERKAAGKPENSTSQLDREWQNDKFRKGKGSTEETPEEFFSEKTKGLIRHINHRDTKYGTHQKDNDKRVSGNLEKEYDLSRKKRSFRRLRERLSDKYRKEKREDTGEPYSDIPQTNEAKYQEEDNQRLSMESKDSTNEFDDDVKENDEAKSNYESPHKPIKQMDKIVYPKERNEKSEGNITRIPKNPYEDYVIVLSEDTNCDIIQKNNASHRRDEDLNKRDLLHREHMTQLDNDTIQTNNLTQKTESLHRNEDVEYLVDDSDENIKQSDEPIEPVVNTPETIYRNKEPRNIICGGYGKELHVDPQSNDEPTYINQLRLQKTSQIPRNITDVTNITNQKDDSNKPEEIEDYTTDEKSNEENQDDVLDHDIDECISDVNEAFQSIHILSNQPKWTVLDFAKRETDFRLKDLEDENIFGSFLDNERDFCVETRNNGSENVLFKIKIRVDREAIMPEDEFHEIPASNDADYTQEEAVDYAEYDEAEYHEIPAGNDADTQEEGIYNAEDEEVEYCTIDEALYDQEGRNLSGTIFDQDQNPRIEIIGNDRNGVGYMPQLNIPNAQYSVVRELIEAEDVFLMKMRFIIDNYLIHFRELNISPDIEIVFGNIEEIHRVTEKFHLSMRQCNSIEEIAMVFLRNPQMFDCYTRYIRNKSRSFQYANTSFRELLQKRQLQLEDHYTCDSYLLNPVQIPGTYKFLLQKLQTALHKNGESCKSLDEAIELLNEKICETNTAIAIDSIKCCPFNLEEMGPLLINDILNIKRKYKSAIFLFKGMVVFCVEDQYDPNFYEYKESIEMNKLALKHCNSAMNFQLSCFDKLRRYSSEDDYIFDIEATSMTVKEKWVDEIQRILWEQLQYHKDQQKRSSQISAEITEEEHLYYEIPFADINSNTGALANESVYHVIEDNAMYDEECNKMSGTFFDKYENPRIEIIASEFHTENEIYMKNIPRPQAMVIKELINTEETYLKILKRVINNYLLYFRQMNVNSDIETVFGNIEDICKETEKFYLKLRESESVEKVAKSFLNNVRLFDMYIHYMRNKSASYNMGNTKFRELIRNRQIELEDQSTCDSYLLNPIQRPTRHKLMLEKLQKELSKTGKTCKSLNKAIALVDSRITEANTLMTIDSIKECSLPLRKMGALKIKEIFNIKRKYRSVVFLFEEVVIFCKENPTDAEKYIYADSIEMTKLSLSYNRSSTSFQLKNFDKSKSGEESKYTFDIEAPSISIKEQWIEKIQELLWRQLQHYKDEQKKGGVDSVVPKKSKSKKSSLKEKSRTSDISSNTQKRSTFYYDIK